MRHIYETRTVCEHCGQPVIFRERTWVTVAGAAWFGFCGKAGEANDWRHAPTRERVA